MRPVEQRIELDETPGGVGSNEAHVAAMSRLFRPQSRYPAPRAIQSAGERIDLADLTAGEPSSLGFVESIYALTRYQVLDIAASRIVGANLDAIASFGGDPNRVGLLEQASGIECDGIN